MRQSITIFLVLFLLSLNTYGQQVSLGGKVFDRQKEPVAYASVALMDKDGKQLITGTISDGDGLFTIRGLAKGEYLLSVSFVGYKALKLPVSLQRDEQLECLLEDDAVALGEVTVEVNRSNTVKQSASGQTFMLSAISMKKKDVLQALQEIPTLIVDLDTRKITMNDGGKPLVLVNGVRREGGLSSVRPEDILSVDVAHTASAEFMREGYTSVVNIKTKKADRKYTSFNGGVNAHPTLLFGIADASLEIGNSESSLYLTAQSFAFLNNKSHMKEITSTENSLRNLSYRRNSHYNDTYVALGGDRIWSDADYSSFSVTFDYIPQRSKADGEDLLTDKGTDAVTPYQHWRELDDKLYVGSVNAYHKHRFVNASVFDLLWQLSLSKNVNRVNQTEDNEQASYTYLYDFHNSRVGISLAPSFQFHWLGFDSKVGLDVNYQFNRIQEREEIASTFKHREWNQYLYLDINRKWGGFSLAASLGMDIIYRNVAGYSDHYYNLRPVLNLNHRFSAHHSLTLNFSRQSVAPGVVQLNPYNSSSDTLTVSTGNPYLKPYHISKCRLAYTFTGGGFYIEPSMSYRWIDDAIVSIGEDQGGYYMKSLANQGKSTLLSTGINARYSIKRLGYIGFSLNYNHLEFTDIDQKNDYFSGRFYGNLNVKKFGLNFVYGLPNRTYDMYVRNYSSPESNVTLSYDISNRWDVSVGMRFVGWKKHIERHTDMPGYSYYYDNRFTNRGNILMFGVRYKYQGSTKAKREQRKLQNSDKGFRVISE